jgi:hypothetical protein
MSWESLADLRAGLFNDKKNPINCSDRVYCAVAVCVVTAA